MAAAAAACFDPQFHAAACGPGGECPDGTSCVAGVCTAYVDPEAPTTPGCPTGQVTSLSGTVFAPNGTLPLHDVLIYVPPDGDLPPLPEGASCTPCGDPPSQVLARSGVDGTFALRHVPAGEDVRVVLETGKWRRQIVVPAVPACVDTPLAPDLTRLPRTRAEGDLPRIAVTTGSADTLECLLRKVGIDDGEVGIEGGPERVHLYAGTGGASRFLSGASFTPAAGMWSDPAKLGVYDHVLLSCEGTANPTTKPPQATDAMYAYTAAGGRVLAEHFHSYWLTAGPPQLQQLATFGTSDNFASVDAQIDTSGPRGAALAAWLSAAGASTVPGRVFIAPGRRSARTLGPTVERLVHHPDPDGRGPTHQMFAFTTPPDQPEAQRCGRFVFSDAHFTSDASASDDPFPAECTSEPMRPQEKLLAYALFDLGRCVGGP
jgi:hypothetical protein